MFGQCLISPQHKLLSLVIIFFKSLIINLVCGIGVVLNVEEDIVLLIFLRSTAVELLHTFVLSFLMDIIELNDNLGISTFTNIKYNKTIDTLKSNMMCIKSSDIQFI